MICHLAVFHPPDTLQIRLNQAPGFPNGRQLPDSVVDIAPLKASFVNNFELGYKGIIGDRLRIAVDGWYQRRENFATPAVNFTPNVLLDPTTLRARFPVARVAALAVLRLLVLALNLPLAIAGISVFALSTYDTDYILVKASDLDAALACLLAAGHAY